MILSEPSLKHKMSKIEHGDDLFIGLGEEINHLILQVQKDCRDLKMSMIPEAAEYAFGDNLSNTCMR